MTSTTSFRDLEVWQESMLLVEEIYSISKSFPREELFGLTAQLRKAAVSIPSNIGEGARRKRRQVTLNHYDVALGSQGEVDVPSRPSWTDAQSPHHLCPTTRDLDLVPGSAGTSVNLEPERNH
jgi:hypothetical protein